MIRPIAGGVTIDVRVLPRSRKPEIAGTRGDALLVRLKAPPIDGAANVELLELLAETLQVRRSAITIVSGATSRQKRVQVNGLDARCAAARLCPDEP